MPSSYVLDSPALGRAAGDVKGRVDVYSKGNGVQPPAEPELTHHVRVEHCFSHGIFCGHEVCLYGGLRD